MKQFEEILIDEYNPINSPQRIIDWVKEMSIKFPAMNGLLKRSVETSYVTDYYFFKDVLFAQFRFSVSEEATKDAVALAEKLNLGVKDFNGS